MRVAQRVRDLVDDPKRLRHRKLPVARQPIAQRLSFEVRQHIEEES
jgi:hypothetical protein